MIRTSTRSLTLLSFSIALLISVCALSSLAYGGSSDLTIESIWLEKASAPGVPVAGTDLPVNESFNIVASVKNLGQETALGFFLDVYYDSDFGRGGPDNIAPGEVQQWYVGPLTALAGTHTTQWVADPDTKIAELNEGNNQKALTFAISTVKVTATKTVTGTTTSTVTSYTGTRTMTSTIVVPTTVVLVPLTVTSTVQSTRYQTSVLTTTVASYTSTQSSTSTIVVPTTVTIGPLASTGIGETVQVLTSTGTMTVTGHTTTTVTSYTGTSTSTSTVVVYTSVAKAAASVGAPNLLAYVGFLSLFAVTVGRRVIAGGKGWKIPRVVSCRGPLSTSSPLSSVPTLVERGAH